MATVTLQLTQSRQARLRRMARARGVSVNKLMEESSAIGLAQFEAEVRFLALAAKGSPARALALLDKVDAKFGRNAISRLAGSS